MNLPWSKPKTPGFGISGSYYLTILASHATLPSVSDIINPRGERGAVTGFGVPLAPGADKSTLDVPMTRGSFALASIDRKTLIRVLVMSKEEAGFDPEAFVRSQEATDAEPEMIARLRGTWTVAQMTFESFDPGVFPALTLFLSIARRFADLAEGVVADPVSQRYLLPEQVIHPSSGGDLPVDVRDLVRVQLEDRPTGLYAYTLGMQKVGLPELELAGGVRQSSEDTVRFLLGICKGILRGRPLKAGDRVGSAAAPFQIAVGGLDRGKWEGIPCFELLPPTKVTTADALAEWRSSEPS